MMMALILLLIGSLMTATLILSLFGSYLTYKAIKEYERILENEQIDE